MNENKPIKLFTEGKDALIDNLEMSADFESEYSFNSADLNANRVYCNDSRQEEAEDRTTKQIDKVQTLNFNVKLNLNPLKTKDLKKDD